MANSSKEFYNLDIWRRGYDILMAIYRVTARFSPDNQFLAQQLRESANLIIAKIAEAQIQSKNSQKQRLLTLSCGKIEETLSHLTVARGLGLVKPENWQVLVREYRILGQRINNYIENLDKQSPERPFSGQKQKPAKKKNIPQELTERQEKILNLLKEKDKVNFSQILEMFPEVGPRSLRRDISILFQKDLLARQGRGRKTFYTPNSKQKPVQSIVTK